MGQKLGYHITDTLKNEYEEFIINQFGYKRNKCGAEVENAMKFYLAANGHEEYQDDLDVQDMLKKVNQNMNNTSTIKSKSKDNNNLEELIERKLDEKFAQFERKVRRESSKKHGHAEFKKQFQMAFQDYHQASKKDIEQFIMNHADIVDKRSIQSRIHYLESHDMIESFAPNVYNINVSTLL